MRTKSVKPHIDRGQLEQIIAGLIEGVLLVDTDGTIVQANEAALAMHGCERTEQLGATVAEYRKHFVLRYLNNHLLKARQYPLARVLAGERFDGVTVEVRLRSGGDFRRVHQVRSLLLKGPGDVVESLVLVSEDVTERISAEERFERTFAANPAPALIFRLSDARYIKVNQGFIEMTGFERDRVINCRFRELDVLRKAEHRDDAMRALHERRTIPQQEAMLRVQDGSEKFVIVAGQPIDVGDEPCMLFSFGDLDARKLAEESLRQSEERFAKAFRLAPVPMLVCAQRAWRIIEVNDAFAEVTGYAHRDIFGQAMADTGLWVDMKLLRELGANLDTDVGVRNREIQLRTRDKALIDCVLSAEPVTIRGEACVLCAVRDITERKRSEAELMTAIETVMKDTSWFSRNVMEKLAQVRNPGVMVGIRRELSMLTAREREVLVLICRGLGDAEIAVSLKLSRNTVRNHTASLYDKIGVHRRSAAVIWGRERGLAAY